MLSLDSFLVTASYICAYLLRFDSQISDADWLSIRRTLPFIIPAKICAFYVFGMYKGMWRYTSLIDLINVIKATVASSISIVLGILYIFHFQGYARSVFIIDWVLTVFLVGGMRVFIRLVLANNISALWPLNRHHSSSVKKLLIIGAGSAGEKVVREIFDNPGLKFEPVGFIEDDPNKQGKTIHGVPVLGTVDNLSLITTPYDEILIAIPSAKSAEMRRIVAACEKTAKRFRTMPSIGELIEGRISVKAMREVTLEDLLGREEVRLEQDRIRRCLHNKRILITGAGGSIGSELVRQVCHFHPQSVALLDFSEYNLFQIEMECRQRYEGLSAQSFLADIRDKDAVKRAFSRFRPHIVFHAAAYKHVPIQELNPGEAVFNNVLGSRNIIECALDAGSDQFVLVSTDKAVRPSNVMGATKRIAEMLIESINGMHNTRFMAVRFGNVLRSSGSAIPIFQEQIARGGPVTVTHPEVTRYFMSILEAAQLILQAASMGEGGEIFILDMGKPMRILDLAEDLIRLHGFEPGRDIAIQFIGLRPGEKLYEELITKGEGISATAHEKIMVIRGRPNNLASLQLQINELLTVAQTHDPVSIKKKIREIVPEYQPEL